MIIYQKVDIYSLFFAQSLPATKSFLLYIPDLKLAMVETMKALN